MKNEQRTEDMIEILMHLQKYLPKYDDTSYPTPISFVGDQLTCERIRSAKQARVQSTTPHERFEGIVEMPADWHALVTYYQVRCMAPCSYIYSKTCLKDHSHRKTTCL